MAIQKQKIRSWSENSGHLDAARFTAQYDRGLEVTVLHTSTQGTLRCLRTAASLARDLKAHIRLLVLELVPYPLDVETPRVSVEFTRSRFWTLAADARIDTLVDIRYGRDRVEMLKSALNPASIVVMEHGGWWSRERRLARRLEHLGHQVVTEPN